MSVAEALRTVDIAVFAILAAVSFVQWRRQPSPSARWIFVTFTMLAVVVSSSAVTELVLGDDPGAWVTKPVIALLVLFPYFLYRFAASFRLPSRRIEWFARGLTAGVVIWTLVLPDVPAEGEPRSGSFLAFIVALLVQWVVLSAFVAVRLWQAGRGRPTVARSRMRTLSIAALALSAALIVAGATPSQRADWADALTQLLVFASGLLFLAGFAPPRWLRMLWRRPEDLVLRRTVNELTRASTPEEVTGTVLPAMRAIVGARAAALRDETGSTIAVDGIPPDEEPGVRLSLPSGSVVAWTDPYAPFFGKEEFELLRSLGTVTLLALDRARLFSHEREARIALEEADQLKTQFIALASHELRTPAAVIHGIASTLHLRGERLAGPQRHELRRTLYEQTDRMRRLVEQLLDLSRLEAKGITIKPEPLWVRSRVEELVLMVAGEQASAIAIDVPPDLESFADGDAFDRIVSNLIVNALRYGEAPIRVTAEQPDRYLRLAVEDSGRGVTPEFVPHLFERFTRSAEVDVRTGGAGLGLAIAQSYAHAHGGELLYEPAEPHGARFKLVLLAAPNPL
jgi:signal transduction histidine kinase